MHQHIYILILLLPDNMSSDTPVNIIDIASKWAAGSYT